MTDETKPNTGTASAKKAHVLLVDDDKFLVGMYAMKFEHEGYAVQTCLSADEGLAVLKEGAKFDAILFDILMPERDGFSFLSTVREGNLAPGALLIALTNQSNDAEKQKAAQLGADRYVVKASMIPSEVVSVVEEELKKRAA